MNPQNISILKANIFPLFSKTKVPKKQMLLLGAFCFFLPTVPGGGTVGLQMASFSSSSSSTPPNWRRRRRRRRRRRNISYSYYCTVYCTVLYCTVLYCTVLYCTVLYCTVLYTVQYCTVKKNHPHPPKKNHPPPQKKMSKIKGG